MADAPVPATRAAPARRTARAGDGGAGGGPIWRTTGRKVCGTTTFTLSVSASVWKDKAKDLCGCIGKSSEVDATMGTVAANSGETMAKSIFVPDSCAVFWLGRHVMEPLGKILALSLHDDMSIKLR